MKSTLKTSFTSYKSVAMISGPFFHHLDHLAPLCHFLNCPLLVDDSATYFLGKKYYPEVNIILTKIDLREISLTFNLILLTTKYAKLEIESAYKAMNIHHMRYCYCPHGQSDKGDFDKSMIPEESQDMILLYGEKQKNRLNPKENFHIVGNFRLAYYEKFRSLLDKLIDDEFSSLPKQKTILFAPTWNDHETGSSFFTTWKSLIDSLPSQYNLIIKLHPLLEKHHPADAHRALSFDQSKPNVRILFETPLIYPLLNQIDIYLGDYSAIGHDFLYFNRPLFFFGDRHVPLHKFGQKVSSADEFYSALSNTQHELSNQREIEYHYTFSQFML